MTGLEKALLYSALFFLVASFLGYLYLRVIKGGKPFDF